ncbi:MAG: hypothetical protein DRR19_32580 [Candidatus Parabeggiatoa sp. nov. 1]|nr:MAG: hypothetical protein DRR19_32580 [Gammaproteobacteria bacterium]
MQYLQEAFKNFYGDCQRTLTEISYDYANAREFCRSNRVPKNINIFKHVDKKYYRNFTDKKYRNWHLTEMLFFSIKPITLNGVDSWTLVKQKPVGTVCQSYIKMLSNQRLFPIAPSTFYCL